MSALKLTINSWGEVKLDKSELKKLMRSAGNEIAAKTRAMISQKNGGGRFYHLAGGEYYYASAPGAPPVQLSGKLRGSLKVYTWPDGDGFAVRERQFYSLFLEAGARGGGNPGSRSRRAQARRHRARGLYTARILEPRPHLDVVMDDEKKNLDARVRRAFETGMTWRETK